MKKRVPFLFVYTVLFFCLGYIFCSIPLKAQICPILSHPSAISSDHPTLDVLQWQIGYSLLAEVCEASAGVLTVNVEDGCLMGEELEASTNDTHQTAAGYTLHYALWDVTNPNAPRFKAINTTGIFDAPTETKTYQIYAYSEKTDDAPIPSLITHPHLPITAIGTEQAGCFQVVATNPFKVLGTFRLESVSSVENSNIHIYEICGGQLPYDYDFQTTGGFSTIDEFPSSNPNCRQVRLVYATGATWNLSIKDAGNCGNVLAYSSSSSAFPIISSFEVTPEHCPADFDGAISVFVEGGIKCDAPNEPYAYAWEGSDGFTSDKATITKLKAGFYTVVVTDCIGNTTTESIYVYRGGDEIIGGGRSRAGCRREAGKTALENTAMEWIEVYPNPIVQEAYLEFSLEKSAAIEARLLNFNGQEVTNLFGGKVEEGVKQRIAFSVNELPAGMYILQLQADSGWQYFEKVQVVK